jgi:phage terminase large subunit
MADDSVEIVIPYAPRSQFAAFHDRTQRWSVIVAHRRAGKTVACVNELIKAALTCEKDDGRFAYLAPYHAQAKDIAWDYLVRYSAPIPGLSVNISELRIDYPNGARVRLYGAENAERMRGLYLDGVVIDEPADIDPRVWPEIIRPALSDRQGWATWIGTPKGKNAFWELWDAAQGKPDWFAAMLKASETGLVAEQELADARQSMTPDQYEQEFECSFEAAIQGAYYGKLLNQAEKDKRIGRVPYDPALPVSTSWDLGIGDPCAIWFIQEVGQEVRFIDYYETSGVGLDHYAKVLRERPYSYAAHYLPHDAEAKELGTGRTRVETLKSLGMSNIIVVPAQSVEDGINAVRLLIPRCWYDAEKCKLGLEALRQYRTEFDEKTKTFRNKPLHDWTSHAADAKRTFATGRRKPQKKPAPIKPKWVV